MSDGNIKVSGLGAWVPQIFFDIIARLIPGSVTIGMFALVALGPEQFWCFVKTWLETSEKTFPSVTIILAVGFTISYVIAVLLWGIWFQLCQIDRFLSLKLHLIQNIDPETGVSESHHDFVLRYHYIKHKDASTGSRITKLKAEIHMCGVLILSLLVAIVWNFLEISALINSHAESIPEYSQRTILEAILILTIIACFSARHYFGEHMKEAVKYFSDLLGY